MANWREELVDKFKTFRDRLNDMRAKVGNALNKLDDKKLNKSKELRTDDSIKIDGSSDSSSKYDNEPKLGIKKGWLTEYLDDEGYSKGDDVKDGELTVEGDNGLEIDDNNTFSANEGDDKTIRIQIEDDVRDAIDKGEDAYEWGDHHDAGYAKEEDLSDVATSGDYEDLDNLPDLGDLAELDEVDTDEIKNDAVTDDKLDKQYAEKEYVDETFGHDISFSSGKLKLYDKNDDKLQEVDLSSLSAGDLEVSIDDSGDEPEIVLKQDGDEVGRIPSGDLLENVVVDGKLDDDTLKFYDNSNDKIFEIELEGYVQDDRKINTGDGLTGGDDLSSDITIELDEDTKDHIDKGVDAYDYTLDDVAQNGNETDEILTLNKGWEHKYYHHCGKSIVRPDNDQGVLVTTNNDGDLNDGGITLIVRGSRKNTVWLTFAQIQAYNGSNGIDKVRAVTLGRPDEGKVLELEDGKLAFWITGSSSWSQGTYSFELYSSQGDEKTRIVDVEDVAEDDLPSDIEQEVDIDFEKIATDADIEDTVGEYKIKTGDGIKGTAEKIKNEPTLSFDTDWGDDRYLRSSDLGSMAEESKDDYYTKDEEASQVEDISIPDYEGDLIEMLCFDVGDIDCS